MTTLNRLIETPEMLIDVQDGEVISYKDELFLAHRNPFLTLEPLVDGKADAANF